MATLSEDYQNYYTLDIDKAGLVPAYHIPPSIQQTASISAMPMSSDKSIGLVGKSPHFSPVPLPSMFWQEPNTETRLQCLDHLAAAAAGIKISPNVYASHNPMSSSSPGLSSIQPSAAAAASYNQSVLEKMYFQHQQDKMQLQYQQRHLAAQEEQKVSLMNSGHPTSPNMSQIGLFSPPARPSPRLPITQYLYNMYGSKYRYANPVVLQQYQGMPSAQDQWNSPINGIQKNLDSRTFDKAIRDRSNQASLQNPYKSSSEMVIPAPKHQSPLLPPAQSHGVSSDNMDAIDIDKLSSIGLPPTNTTATAAAAAAAACGGPHNPCLHPESCLPCTEANRLLYNFCKTSSQNSQKCKDACSTSFNSSTSSTTRNSAKNNGTESSNCCNSNAKVPGNSKNNSLSLSRSGLSGDYQSSYPSMHPNPWPSSTSTTSSSPSLFTSPLPTQTTFSLPASSPSASYYPYANIRNELGDPRNAIYSYGIEDPMTRISRPRGIFSTRYHPFERERRI